MSLALETPGGDVQLIGLRQGEGISFEGDQGEGVSRHQKGSDTVNRACLRDFQKPTLDSLLLKYILIVPHFGCGNPPLYLSEYLSDYLLLASPASPSFLRL